MTTPDTEQPFVSPEEAERRTNREAALLIGGGFMFICAPTLLCYSEYRLVAFLVLLTVAALSGALWTLIFVLQTADLLTWLGLRKRKERFLSAEELENANRQ
jgi:hypothetical protein